MHRRLPRLNPSRTTRGATLLPLVVVVLIALGLFVLWLTSQAARTPVSVEEQSPAVNELESGRQREPATLVEPSTASDRTAVKTREEAPAEERIDVHVSTRVALMPSSKPVPRIQVEVGYGTSFEEGDEVLGTGTTDDAGEAVVSVPKRALNQVTLVGGARYWARVVQPGYQRRTNGVSRAPGGDPSRIVVIAFPGNTLTGRVVDESGQLVPASVSTRYLHANGKIVQGFVGQTTATGHFVLQANEARTLILVADAGRNGTGVIADVAVPRPDGCEPLTIVVRGPGIVRGRVRDANGGPTVGLDLLVLVAELDDEKGSFVLPEPRGTEVELEGRGRSWHTLTTAADGSFAAEGLRDDRYVVRARTTKASGYPILLTRESAQANGVALDLALSRPHIVVRVVDLEGAPFQDELSCDDKWANRTEENPLARPRVVVSAARDAAQAFARGSYSVSGRPLASSTYAFDVVDQREYTVALFGGGLQFVARNVTIPSGSGRVEVVLTAAKARAFGTVDVEPKLSDGSDPKTGLVLRLEEATTGFPFVDRQVDYVDGKRVALSAPEGTYTLVVEGSAIHEDWHGTRMSARNVGRAEMTVVVRTGETIHVEPVLGSGARLRVKLEGEPNDDDRAAFDKRYPGATWGGPEDWSTLVEMQLTAPGRWPTPVLFQYELTGSSAMGTHERSKLVLGTEATSELLPSGSYALEARMPGGRVASTPVTLVDGSTTTVTVQIR